MTIRDLDTSVGFDLGTANFGWAVVRRYPGTSIAGDSAWQFTLIASGVVHTSADNTFGRKSNDDVRRLREISHAVRRIFTEFNPGIVGFENYVVFDDANIETLKESAKLVVGIFGGATKAAPSKDQLVAALASAAIFERLMGAVVEMGESIKLVRATRGKGAAAKVLAVQGLVCEAAFSRNVPVLPFTPADLKRRATGGKGASKEDVMRGLAKFVHEFDSRLSYLPATHRNHAADAVGHAVLALEHGGVGIG